MFYTHLCLDTKTVDKALRPSEGVVSQTGRQSGEWWHCFTGVITCLVAAYTFTWLKFGLDWSWRDLFLFCFLHKVSSSIPNCHFCCYILYLDLLFYWSKKYQFHAHLCSIKVSARHWHSPLCLWELKFCTPKMPYKMRGDTQKYHRKARVREILPVGSFPCWCLWSLVGFLEWSKKEFRIM